MLPGAFGCEQVSRAGCCRSEVGSRLVMRTATALVVGSGAPPWTARVSIFMRASDSFLLARQQLSRRGAGYTRVICSALARRTFFRQEAAGVAGFEPGRRGAAARLPGAKRAGRPSRDQSDAARAKTLHAPTGRAGAAGRAGGSGWPLGRAPGRRWAGGPRHGRSGRGPASVRPGSRPAAEAGQAEVEAGQVFLVIDGAQVGM